jgi:GTPase
MGLIKSALESILVIVEFVPFLVSANDMAVSSQFGKMLHFLGDVLEISSGFGRVLDVVDTFLL